MSRPATFALVCLICAGVASALQQDAIRASHEPQKVASGALRSLKDDLSGYDDDDSTGPSKSAVSWYHSHCGNVRKVIRFRTSTYSGDDDGFGDDKRRRLMDDGYGHDDDDSSVSFRPKYRSCSSYRKWFSSYGYDFDDDFGSFDNDDRRRRLMGRNFY